MNSTTQNTAFSLTNVLCNTFGHNYSITRKVTEHINEYQCSHCGREMTDNYSGNVEILTHQIKKVNTTLSTFLQKRKNKLSA